MPVWSKGRKWWGGRRSSKTKQNIEEDNASYLDELQAEIQATDAIKHPHTFDRVVSPTDVTQPAIIVTTSSGDDVKLHPKHPQHILRDSSSDSSTATNTSTEGRGSLHVSNKTSTSSYCIVNAPSASSAAMLAAYNPEDVMIHVKNSLPADMACSAPVISPNRKFSVDVSSSVDVTSSVDTNATCTSPTGTTAVSTSDDTLLGGDGLIGDDVTAPGDSHSITPAGESIKSPENSINKPAETNTNKSISDIVPEGFNPPSHDTDTDTTAEDNRYGNTTTSSVTTTFTSPEVVNSWPESKCRLARLKAQKRLIAAKVNRMQNRKSANPAFKEQTAAFYLKQVIEEMCAEG